MPRERSLVVSTRRRVVCLALASLLATVVTPVASARAPQPSKEGSVAMGESLFWNGNAEPASSTGAHLPYPLSRTETCGTVDPDLDPCWAYEFEVTETAKNARLRLAIDANRRGECFDFELWAPDTYNDPAAEPKSVARQCPEILGTGVSPSQWTMELLPDLRSPSYITNPAVGTWTVRVIPYLVNDWAFRLRVRLEEKPTLTQRVVRPNMQAYPPYEFGFEAPANPNAGTAIDKQNEQKLPGVSCTTDEQTEAREHGEIPPLRCLRFSAAMYNVGEGPLDLLLQGGPEATSGEVVQRLHLENGDLCVDENGDLQCESEEHQHPAGNWTYHESHAHPHYTGFVDFELYPVDATGRVLHRHTRKRVDPSVTGHKAGWNPADQRLADWSRTDHGSAFEGLFFCLNRGERCITQAHGWGDHYRWQRPGNYVDFPTDLNGAIVSGDYVVRMVVDRDNRVLESNDQDNSAYAWIRVRPLGEVLICERGLGDSPWDPQKRIHNASHWVSQSWATTTDSPNTCDVAGTVGG